MLSIIERKSHVTLQIYKDGTNNHIGTCFNTLVHCDNNKSLNKGTKEKVDRRIHIPISVVMHEGISIKHLYSALSQTEVIKMTLKNSLELQFLNQLHNYLHFLLKSSGPAKSERDEFISFEKDIANSTFPAFFKMSIRDRYM